MRLNPMNHFKLRISPNRILPNKPCQVNGYTLVKVLCNRLIATGTLCAGYLTEKMKLVALLVTIASAVVQFPCNDLVKSTHITALLNIVNKMHTPCMPRIT